MKVPSRSSEANLLYARRPDLNPADLATDLTTYLSETGVAVQEVSTIPRQQLLVHCDEVQILVAVAQVPFALDVFEGAARPDASKDVNEQVFELLWAHNASVTVMVAQRPGAERVAGPGLKRRICRRITAMIVRAAQPTLVYWCETDMLFSAREFARTMAMRRSARAPDSHHELWEQTPSTGHGGAEHRPDRTPTVPDTPTSDPVCPAWMRVSRGLPPVSEDDHMFDTRAAKEPSGKVATFLLIAIMAVLCFPVAAGTLFYNILRGENPKLTAHVLSITCLAIALDLASYPAKAMTLF